MSKKIMTPEEVEKGEVKSELEEPKNAVLSTVIYVGPNLHGGKLVCSSVFRGGLPPYIRDLAEKYPEIKTLIVPIGEYGSAKQAVETKGTELNRIYEQLKILRIKDEEVKA